NDAQPTQGCCNGVSSLVAAAQSTEDKRSACSCIKSLASSASQASYDKAGKLPGLCGVNLGYTITPSIDCATIT
ncbi:hypothetical protein KI387_019768, partial [Taxus chinensis]